MVNEHKKVVLEQLADIDGIKFKMIKSLLNKELHLTDKMQEDYDIIKIANLLEEKFPKDAGVSKLLEVCKNMSLLETLAQNLKKKAKAQKKKKRKSNTTQKNTQQGEPTAFQPECTRNESSKDTPSSKKKKSKTTDTEGLKKECTQEQNQLPERAKKRKKTITTEDFKKTKLTREQNQLPEPSVTNALKTEDSHQTPHMPLSISPSNFFAKKQKSSIQNFGDINGNMLSQLSQFATTSAFSIDFAESQVQTPPKPPPNPSRHSSSKKPRSGIVPTEPSMEDGFQQGPKQVMVLKVTKPFTYDMIEEKQMFHATVATETEFFRVKVFDIVLRTKFVPNKVIAISGYFGRNGFLEIYNDDCVSEMRNSQMDISTTLKRKACATPKISELFLKKNGLCVNGSFRVHEKKVKNECIYYGVQDDTGMMEVVVYGRLTKIMCEPNDSLRLFCFELASSTDTWQLKSVRHSYMQVIKHKKRGTINQP